MPKIGPPKWPKPLKDRAKKWQIWTPAKIDLAEAEGGSRVYASARARARRARAPRPSDVAMDFQRNVGRSDPKPENGPKNGKKGGIEENWAKTGTAKKKRGQKMPGRRKPDAGR